MIHFGRTSASSVKSARLPKNPTLARRVKTRNSHVFDWTEIRTDLSDVAFILVVDRFMTVAKSEPLGRAHIMSVLEIVIC
jgi:hypothetical protein